MCSFFPILCCTGGVSYSRSIVACEPAHFWGGKGNKAGKKGGGRERENEPARCPRDFVPP